MKQGENVKIIKEVDLRHLVSPAMKDSLKKEIQGIITDALSGQVEAYRLEQDGYSYIRWGLVEKEINHAIDLYWPEVEKNE